MKLAICLLLLIITITPKAPNYAQKNYQSGKDEQIVSVVKRWWNGWATREISSLEEIANENFIEFTGSGTKRSEGKRKLLETAKAVMPLLELENWEIKDVKVVFHGETAICNYYFSEKGKFRGKEYQSSGNATDIFVRKKGGWKMVSHHGTQFNKIITDSSSQNSSGGVVEIIRYNLPAGKADDFAAIYQEISQYLAASSHCRSYQVLRGVEDANRFIIIIEWDSIEGHEKGFTNSADFPKFITPLRPYLQYIEEMKHYEKTAIAWAR